LDDVALLASAAILPVFLITWFYQLIYILLGMAVVYMLGRRLSPIEHAQPALITCTEQSLTYDYPHEKRPTVIQWRDVEGWFSLHYCLRRRPLALFSATLLTSIAGPSLVLEGVTSGYTQLGRDIQTRLRAVQPELQKNDRDFVIFDRRWLLAVTVTVALLALYLLVTGIASLEYTVTPESMGGVVLDKIPADAAGDKTVAVWLTSAIFAFLPTWLLLGAAVILWRLTFHQVRMVRLHRRSYPTLPIPLFAAVAILLSLLTILWLILVHLQA
jgi:hypothetical protein